jgi:hypothetical protein
VKAKASQRHKAEQIEAAAAAPNVYTDIVVDARYKLAKEMKKAK